MFAIATENGGAGTFRRAGEEGGWPSSQRARLKHTERGQLKVRVRERTEADAKASGPGALPGREPFGVVAGRGEGIRCKCDQGSNPRDYTHVSPGHLLF